jgi:hypothetical protein
MAAAALRPLVAGNWKMNGLAAGTGELAGIINGAAGIAADLMVCPPATLIARFAEAVRGSKVTIGGQDCHAEATGAHTGDIAAEMLADAGAVAVIVGHSERRADHDETDAQVRAKALARTGLASPPSSASANSGPSARPARRSPSSAANWPARCRMARPAAIWSSPMSRFGPLEPA